MLQLNNAPKHSVRFPWFLTIIEFLIMDSKIPTLNTRCRHELGKSETWAREI